MAGLAQKKLITLIIPVLNEEQGIAGLWSALQPHLNRQDEDFEVLFVDDGSTDKTLETLLSLARDESSVRVVELSRNFGKESALTAGLDHARGDAVIPLDADLQDPPELIGALIDKWREGFDVVLARRVDRSRDSYAKRTTSSIFYTLHNAMAPVPLPKNAGDFRLMDRVVIDALKRLPERQRFMKGLFSWVGFKTATVDYARPPRAVGESRFSGWKLWNLALEGFTSFSTIPLRVWTYVGLLSAAVTFCYGLYILTRTLIFGIDVPGYASLFVAVLMLGSLQLVSIGVLGEYLGRVYHETKQRPAYIVRKCHGAGGV